MKPEGINMRKVVRLLATVFLLTLTPALLSAQANGTISGRVIDRATQLPVQGAQVIVVGTQRGTQTDQEGRYTISGLPEGSYQVTVRRVGYGSTSQRVNVTAGVPATAEFALSVTATRLEEVVVNAVTGQEERRLENGTNAGNINVGELDKGPITKMADVLQARVAGVTLQSVGGATGAGQRIRVRGANSLSLSNEPLLYLDGVRVSNGKGGIDTGGGDYSRLNDINPEEIDDIQILKGPAASAIYGSAAANGVLLITTKKGIAGKPVWKGYLETGKLEDKNNYPLNYAAMSRNDPTSTEYYVVDPNPDGTINNEYLYTTNVFGPGSPFTLCHNYMVAAGTCKQDVTLSFDQF